MDHGSNVIDELVTDHRTVEELFGRVEVLPSGDRRRKLFADRAITELVRHAVAEEAYLYPAVRRHLAHGEARADKEIDDHSRAEEIMKDLEFRDADDADFDRLLGMLVIEVRSHMEDEEADLFPALRASCDEDSLNRLGGRVRRARETAPIRPHPDAPDAASAGRLLAPGAGMVDRMREALVGGEGE
ncbi:hemerythrin domain-containing protein [Streptomyces sp. MS06]|uniref:hemerythrin domain-containing protein n=1 Tax=Streptomyces sp. MS06 TaxID=3385974 RepID=UPI0039A27034